MSTSKNYTQDSNFYFIADFETITHDTNYFKKNKDTCVNLWGIQKLGDFESKSSYGIDIRSFIEYLFNLEKSSTIFFHNLGFDGDFIFKYLVNEMNLSLDKSKSCHVEYFKNGNKLYYLKIVRKWTKNKVTKKQIIIFRCSLLLLSSSVEMLGLSHNIAKHDGITKYNYEKFEKLEDIPNDFLNYMWRDIEIVNRSLCDFFETIKNLDIIKTKQTNFNPMHFITAASLTIKLLKLYLKDYNFRRHNSQRVNIYLNSQKMYEKMEQFYSGGFTQFNPLYQDLNFYEPIPQKGIMIDINSAYPFHFRNRLPFGEWTTKKNGDTNIEWLELEIESASIKKEYENFIILRNWKKEGETRYVRNLENFKCYYLKNEWDFINKIYDIKIKSKISYYQKSAKWGEIYVNVLYDLKSQAKSSGKKGEEFIYKILLNSLYGKFGQRLEFESMFYLEDKDLEKGQIAIIDNKVYEILRESTNAYWISDKYNCYFCKSEKKPKIYNKSIASYITSKQRVYLWENILANNPNNWIYSDTDSNIFKEIELKNTPIGKKLGEWSIDAKFDFIAISGAKRYMLYNNNKEPIKTAFANVKKDKIINLLDKYNYNNDIIKFENATLQRKSFKSGIILIPVELTIMKGKY